MRDNIIINVRGTSGAGKTTLIRAIMKQYANIEPVHIGGRKMPIGYMLTDSENWTRPPLFIPGHYESACGGCDTISKDYEMKGNSYDQIFRLINDHYTVGHDVLFEGLLLSGDAARCTKLHGTSRLHVVCINIPVEECIASVIQRRKDKGNEKPFDETNTRDKHKLMQKCIKKFQDAGMSVKDCPTRELARVVVAELLGIIEDEPHAETAEENVGQPA